MAVSLVSDQLMPIGNGHSSSLRDLALEPEGYGITGANYHSRYDSTSSKPRQNGIYPISHPTGLPTRVNGEQQVTRQNGRKESNEKMNGTMMTRSKEDHYLKKQRSQQYNEVFASQTSNVSLRDQALRETFVSAEIRTNVIIKDEYTFMTDFAEHLTHRYHRPVSSIITSLHHSSCLLFGGSFDPAYILTISAIPSLVLPTLNKRNAALVQAFLAEAIQVPLHRGVVRFVAAPEENYATNGMTIQGALEIPRQLRLEQQGKISEESNKGARKSRDSHRQRVVKRMASKEQGSLNGGNNGGGGAGAGGGGGGGNSAGHSRHGSIKEDEVLRFPEKQRPVVAPDIPEKDEYYDAVQIENKVKGLNKKKSFVQTIFGR